MRTGKKWQSALKDAIVIIMSKIYRYCQENAIDVLLYLSDHSETQECGHDPRPGKFTQEMAEIPMWLYVSPEFQQKRPDLAQGLALLPQQIFTNDLLFEMFLHLMDIKMPSTSQALDILSPEYSLNLENARTIEGTVPIHEKKVATITD